MWNLRITPGSTAPIYQQIVSQIRHTIALGQVAEGDSLPSVRALAEQLLINPNTVAKAYADLTDRKFDFCECRRGGEGVGGLLLPHDQNQPREWGKRLHNQNRPRRKGLLV